jgi:hypothetical protein
MWGSASADRSLTASGFLPRTPSPAFGSDPGYSGLASGSPRRSGACPGPAGTPRAVRDRPPAPRGVATASPTGFTGVRPPLRRSVGRQCTGFGRRPLPGRTVTTGRQRRAAMRVRLLTRGTLRRVRNAPRGSRQSEAAFGRPPKGRLKRNAVNPRPVAGCNRPATPARRKPSRWCETTRAERDRHLAAPVRRELRLPGVDAREVHRRQGEESQERRNQRKAVPASPRAL